MDLIDQIRKRISQMVIEINWNISSIWIRAHAEHQGNENINLETKAAASTQKVAIRYQKLF